MKKAEQIQKEKIEKIDNFLLWCYGAITFIEVSNRIYLKSLQNEIPDIFIKKQRITGCYEFICPVGTFWVKTTEELISLIKMRMEILETTKRNLKNIDLDRLNNYYTLLDTIQYDINLLEKTV